MNENAGYNSASTALIILSFSVADELLSCQTIQITLKNEVLTHHGEYQDTYEMSASVNGKPSWTSQSTAIWKSQDYNGWMIGNLKDIGKPSGTIGTGDLLSRAKENVVMCLCHGKIGTNDFSIECIARKGNNQQLL